MAPKKSVDIQKSAKKLRKLSPLTQRSEIKIPDGLITGKGDFQSQYDSIVKPQWDHLAGILEAGNYREILSLLKRLEKKKSDAQTRIDQTRKEFRQYQMLFNLLLDEAKISGEDVKIGDALGLTDPKENFPDFWQWVVSPNSGSEDSAAIDRTYYTPKPTKRFKASFSAGKVPNLPVPFRGNQTWKKAIDRVERLARLLRNRELHVIALLEIIRFRIEVTEAVLWEYEILGDVSFYSHKKLQDGLDEAPPDDRLVLFIKTGIELFEEDQDFNNREALINGVLLKLEWEEIDSRRIRDQLESADLYNSQGKRGRTLKLDERPLLEKLIVIWKAYLEKGKKAEKGDS